MADKLTINCTVHDGGKFAIIPKRGRRPSKCTEVNPCTAHPQFASIRATQRRVTRAAGLETVKDDSGKVVAIQGPSRVELAASSIKNQRITSYVEQLNGMDMTATAVAPVESEPKPQPVRNPCLPMAKAAKERLVALGWTCKGRAWLEEPGLNTVAVPCAEVIASRGDELLTMSWRDGKLIKQDYSLWSPDVPAEKQRPIHKLGFDPDETSDRELVQLLSGVRVTWWNKLAGASDSAIMGTDKIRIEHCYTGTGDETPDDRIIHFCDPSSGGFRSFRVGALLKIG